MNHSFCKSLTRISIILISGFINFLFCTMGSEVQNEKSIIFMSDGKTPATFAKVQLIPVDLIPDNNLNQSKFHETYTDGNGRYSFSEIPHGIYNLVARKDSLASFTDSIPISTESDFPSDTLGLTSSFSARVILQPNHDPRTVIIQVIGTTIYYANVDSSGYFTLPGMAAGTYQLRLETSISGYTPTFYTLTMPKADTVQPQIRMIYTGIPVVSGLKAVYNPLSAVIKVSWQPVVYQFLSNYVLYRDDPQSMKDAPTRFANVSDTVFYDSLSDVKTDLKTTLTFRYRVAVQNRSMAIGETFGYIDCKAILSNSLPQLFQKDTIRFSPNVPCNLHIQNPEELDEISEYFLDIGEKGNFIRFHGPDTAITIKARGDTIIPDLPCVVKVQSSNGIEIKDTVHLQSNFTWTKVSDLPITNARGFRSVSFDEKIFLFAELDNSTERKCVLWSSPDGTQWSLLSDSLPFSRLLLQPLVFNNRIVFPERDTLKKSITIWYSNNGKDWLAEQADSLANSGYPGDFDVWSKMDKNLIFTNYNPSCADQQCPSNWISDDGVAWKAVTIKNSTLPDRFDTPNKNFTACEFNGQLVLCGAWRALYLTYPIWSTYALRIWKTIGSDPLQIQLPAPLFSDAIGEYNPALVEYNEDLFLTAQINMENSIDISHNTKFMWVLLSNNRWYLCSDTYPAPHGATMKSYYHSLCVHHDQLFSLNSSGIWTVTQ